MRPLHLRTTPWVALLLLACAPERGALNASSEVSDVENVEWTLTELDGAAIALGSRAAPTLKLSSKERRASGFAGCNRYSGSYELIGARLRFGALAATRMACPESTPETALLKALAEISSWKLEGRTLELSDDTQAVRTRWTATASPASPRAR